MKILKKDLKEQVSARCGAAEKACSVSAIMSLLSLSFHVLLMSLFSLMLLFTIPSNAQKSMKTAEKKDSVAFFKGFAVSADLVGPVQMLTGDYGQYEAALRINLRDKYFPVIEIGLGKADHENDATQIKYKTNAPYFKIGADFNLLKNKHDIYRLYAGVRYAFTSFKYDVSCPDVQDPVWGDDVTYSATDVKCSYHWIEALIGVDAKIWGPLHLGWSVRYRGRISYDDGYLGNSWYVPGFGKTGSSNIGGTFNVSIDI